MLLKAMLSTPLGPMLAVASPAGLCGLEFDRPERATRLWRRLERWRPAEAVEDGDVPPFEAARAWLDDYFARRWDACKARDVALDLLGTLFERAVWQALETIDAGTTTTYGAIAAAVERRDAARAVGAAVGANPVFAHRALPPRGRDERVAHRLRRRARPQGVVVAPRRSAAAVNAVDIGPIAPADRRQPAVGPVPHLA